MVRNEQLETKFLSWLENAADKPEDAWDRGMLLYTAAQIYHATKDEKFGNVLVELIDGYTENSCLICENEEDMSNMMAGNSCFVAASYTGDKKYTELAQKLAKQLNTQPKSAGGYFVASDKSECLCQPYCTQKFFMNYETKLGGKERYNNIIDQYISIDGALYEKTFNEARQSEEALEAMDYYAASLIDTMEVMEQPLYEIFKQLQDFFKKTVKDIIAIRKENGKTEILSQDLIFAYAVLKGCRMKALHTEKYEAVALEVFEQVNSMDISLDDEDITFVAAYAMCYSESIKNREYQDYGRGKGGALWS